MRKRPDGLYQLSVMVGYGPDGKPKRKVVYGKTQREVKEKAGTIQMQHNMGLELDNDITVSEWANRWLKTYKSGVEYKTYEMYSGIIKNYVVAILGNMRLKDVKVAHLQDIVNQNSNKSWIVTKFKLTVSQMFEQAALNDLIIKNPAKGIKLPVILKHSKRRAFTDEEMHNIISLPLDKRTRCFIYLLLYTGARKSEALALTKGDICKETMQVTINKSLVFKSNQSEIKDNPKTQAGVRVIPILKPLRDVLFDYISSIDTDLLFPSQKGHTMTDTGYRRMWAKFVKAMDTSDITAHSFRHNYATILYNAGVDVKAAQSILGHSSISVTMDIYTHLSNQNRDEAASKLNSFLADYN